ncbi:hypothetical protein V6N13_011288 [Hibiscus sabdariffa]
MHDSGCLPLRQPLKQERFLRRCCFFLSLYLLLIVSTVGLGGLMVVFVLKPQKPVFSVQTVTLDAYQLNVYSNSTLQVLSGGWLQDQQGQNIVPMKLSGDIKVNLHFLHITLPKIKVALDCDMNFEHRDLEFLNEVYNKKAAKDLYASFFNGSKSFLKKCALAIYI